MHRSTTGTLYLLPVTLGSSDHEAVLPMEVVNIARNLEYFVVEDERSARRFLSKIKTTKPVRELSMRTLNEHTQDKELPDLLVPLLNGHDIGLMSEAGCPGIADPGAQLVALAHSKHIQVKPLVGPSSILLALISSGLNGQRFRFLGYLPTEKTARIKKLKELERHSANLNETQIFIETPYRNQHLFDDILSTCDTDTKLCVACNLTVDGEYVRTLSIGEWRKSDPPDLHRLPSVFLILGS
jgi:16S rRNA (cytidine1402-2'-O)-methyltransferase